MPSCDCNECGRIFQSKRALTAHLEKTHGESAEFICRDCFKSFTTRAGLHYHFKKLGHTPPAGYRPRKRKSDNVEKIELKIDSNLTALEAADHLRQLADDGKLPENARVGGAIGFRACRLGRVDSELHLFPLHQGRDVPYPRSGLVAKCTKQNAQGTHSIPEKNCTCGVYAVWQWDQLGSFAGEDALNSEIVLLLKGWGKVLPGRQGWRAQYATPTAFAIPKCCGVTTDPVTWTRLACTSDGEFYVAFPEWQGSFKRKGKEYNYPHGNQKIAKTWREKDGSFISIDGPSGWFCLDHMKVKEIKEKGHACFSKDTSNSGPCPLPVIERFRDTFACGRHKPLYFKAEDLQATLSEMYNAKWYPHESLAFMQSLNAEEIGAPQETV